MSASANEGDGNNMPRRTKDEPDVTNDATASAGGSEPSDNGTEEAKAKRSTVDDLPLGPTQTRTGAAATVIQGPNGKRIFTAGGDKGGKIAELLKTRPDLPRKEIAAMVGCSQSRVAEVARVLGLAAARPKSEPAADAEQPSAEKQEVATSVST